VDDCSHSISEQRTLVRTFSTPRSALPGAAAWTSRHATAREKTSNGEQMFPGDCLPIFPMEAPPFSRPELCEKNARIRRAKHHPLSLRLAIFRPARGQALIEFLVCKCELFPQMNRERHDYLSFHSKGVVCFGLKKKPGQRRIVAPVIPLYQSISPMTVSGMDRKLSFLWPAAGRCGYIHQHLWCRSGSSPR
jgi:hypothetical protein